MGQITFRIHYWTRTGESLLFERSGGSSQRVPLREAGDGCWTLTLADAESGASLRYRYVLVGPDGEVTTEPLFRQMQVLGVSQFVLDEWLPPEWPDATFRRQAFAGIIFRPDQGPAPAVNESRGRTLVLTVNAPRVMRGFRICVSGSSLVLGRWDPARARVMSGRAYPVWEIELPRLDLAASEEFKFGLWSDREQRLVHFETGPNRRIEDLPWNEESIAVNCAGFRHDTAWKGAGVAIPVFALRTDRGYGIGEFADLEPFAQWAAGCGLHLVQVLPINDTSTDFTWRDSYPYKAISSAALHPVYLSLEDLFAEYRLPLPPGFAERRTALNLLPGLDYEAVLRDKLRELRRLYADVGPKALRRSNFRSFLREQGEWLLPYAAFCRLRDQHGTADFSRWGHHAAYRGAEIARWFKAGAPEYAEVMFHAFVQFHLKAQLDRALASGHDLGVAFKGDLPIGIDRCSVESWTRPELFHLDRQTGAPPDSFSKLGQNWGFPTYDWPRMEAEGFAWWQRRLNHMASCFDALRIDHILGFFRIWEIPLGQTEGILGHFNPALPLSPAQLRERGFTRDVAKFTVPAVAEPDRVDFLGRRGAAQAGQILFRDTDGWFRFRPGYETEPARTAWATATFSTDEAPAVVEGLKRLGYEVLFVPDPDQAGHVHPRINLHETALFRSLAPDEQAILRAVHEDFFHRRHSRFWEAEAMKKLPALMEASRMLICGEDLGMIPDSVPVVLKRLGLLSLEVQSMPKRLGQRFGQPAEYPYLSVCTTSTHDTPTIRGWWEEDLAARQAYWREVMHQPGNPPSVCTPETCRFVVEQSLRGASVWCVLPLQDWLGIDLRLRHPVAADERINVPAVPRHYWRYRMHLTIEELRRAHDFNQKMSRLVADSGRSPGR